MDFPFLRRQPPTIFCHHGWSPCTHRNRGSVSGNIESVLNETRKFPRPKWGEVAGNLHWFKKWDRVRNWDNPPFAKWFEGGKTNLSYNCLDRHLHTWRRNKAAIHWEGEPVGERRTLTYLELHRQVCKFANVLKSSGIKSGDAVALYMPMVPEATIAMLACARIGAIHSVIFGGFAAEAIRDRVNDAQAKVIITQDGSNRRGQVLALKENVDRALKDCPSVTHTLVLKRCNNAIEMTQGRDLDWKTEVAKASGEHQAVEMSAEAPALHPLHLRHHGQAQGHRCTPPAATWSGPLSPRS